IREALSQNDPTNNYKRLDVAISLEWIAEAYALSAFHPHTSSRERLSLCRQAESLLGRALPVFQAQKDGLYGNEAEYLVDAEKTAERCSGLISRARASTAP